MKRSYALDFFRLPMEIFVIIFIALPLAIYTYIQKIPTEEIGFFLHVRTPGLIMFFRHNHIQDIISLVLWIFIILMLK